MIFNLLLSILYPLTSFFYISSIVKSLTFNPHYKVNIKLIVFNPQRAFISYSNWNGIDYYTNKNK